MTIVIKPLGRAAKDSPTLSRMRERVLAIPAALSLAAICGFALAAPGKQVIAAGDGAREHGFVGREGTHFVLDGKPFFVAGVNNHYLTFGSQSEVVRVLDDAVAMGANVVRTFIQPVIGSPTGSVPPTIWDWRQRAYSSDLGVHGTYLVYWDASRNAMALNDGPNGLEKLDFLVDEARKRNLKLIIAFLDFWDFTGGAQQMRAWYGSEDKHTFFFQDERTKDNYKSLVRSILTRLNTVTGTVYRDDPTIFAWELMNEPYIEPKTLLFSWIGEMSSYVKSLDRKHMVTSGQANVDNHLSDITIPSIDFATWHGYPIYYNQTVNDMDKLIVDYCRIAAEAKKPVLLEEFGYARSNPDQAAAYSQWISTIDKNPDCAGWLVWRLVSPQDDLRYPKDEHDQFDVHNDGGPLWNALRAGAVESSKRTPQ
jgi:mannan endo-1,4-beta-mannosidase